MKGRDVIGIAKTGSGKTLAFLLPMFRHVVDQPPLEDTDGPIALIMTPTRELCMQIGNFRVCTNMSVNGQQLFPLLPLFLLVFPPLCMNVNDFVRLWKTGLIFHG